MSNKQIDEKGIPLTYWGGLDNNHIGEANKMVTAVEYLAELESEVQGWGKYQGLSEQNGIKESYINGYNKASNTLMPSNNNPTKPIIEYDGNK